LDIKIRTQREIAIAVAISIIFIILILREIEINYFVGILLIILIISTFIFNPTYFLAGLFLFRSIFDNYFYSTRVFIGGVDIGLGGILSLSLIIGTIYYILIEKKLNKLKILTLYLYCIFCLISILSFFTSPDKISAARVIIYRISILSILALAKTIIRYEKDAKLLLKAIVLSAIVPLFVGGINYIGKGGRISGTFGHPNGLAFYLIIIIGCVFIQIDSSRKYVPLSFWRNIYIGSLIIVLLLTQTRSAWASCVLMLGIFVSLFKKRWIMPLLCFILLIGMLPLVRERIFDIFDTSYGGLSVAKYNSLDMRFGLWRELFNEAIKQPFLGYGINAHLYMLGGISAHNDYLRMFVESGIFGLFIYFGLYIYILVHSLKKYALLKKDIFINKLAKYFICFVPAYFLMSISDNLIDQITAQWYIWGLVGIYFGLIDLRNDKIGKRVMFCKIKYI